MQKFADCGAEHTTANHMYNIVQYFHLITLLMFDIFTAPEQMPEKVTD
jgi:hypothetical protein